MAKKDRLVAIRLTPDEIKRLDVHTKGQMSRSAIVRILVQDFVDKTEKQQRDFLVKRMFGK